MIYAVSLDDCQKVLATPKARGRCPACDSIVIAKCGQINIWHWAHEVDADCQFFSEPESEWHLEWKSRYPKHRTEVLCVKSEVKRFADSMSINGVVIEFQSSSISVEEIIARELFYENMIWVFNSIEAAEKENLNLRYHRNNRAGFWTFRWKHARKTIWECTKPVFLDVGDRNVLEIKKLYEDPASGWGIMLGIPDFLRRFG